jgi:hypothetical protein
VSWLQNSWMDNPTFLAEMAHFAWAYGILLTAALWSATRRQLVCLFGAFVAFAVVKEFWYDLRYEIPADSVAGSTLDFVVYLAGGLAALLVIWIRRRREPKKYTLKFVGPLKPRLYQPEEGYPKNDE